MWKEHNNRIFDGVSKDTAGVLDVIIKELCTWTHAGCSESALVFSSVGS